MNDKILLRQNELELSRKEILNILTFEKDDIVFLAGSLIEGSINPTSKGMGNIYSDIDIFIVSNNTKTISKDSIDDYRSHLKTQFKLLNDINVDIEIYERDLITNLINQINQINFSDSSIRTRNLISLPEGFYFGDFNTFFHRMLNGLPIWNDKCFYQLKNSIVLNNYFKFMSRFSINTADNNYDDVIGNLESNQLEVAVTIARGMMLEAIRAYLFYKNNSIDRDKWIPLKLKNLADIDTEASELYRKFVDLYFNSSLDNEKKLRLNAEDIINLVNDAIFIIGNKEGI